MASRFCQKCCRLHALVFFDAAKRTCAAKLAHCNLTRRRGRVAHPGAGDARAAEAAGRVLRARTISSPGRWARSEPEQDDELAPLPPLAAPWFDTLGDSAAALFGDDVISLEALLAADGCMTGGGDASSAQSRALGPCGALQPLLPGEPWMLRPATPHFAV